MIACSHRCSYNLLACLFQLAYILMRYKHMETNSCINFSVCAYALPSVGMDIEQGLLHTDYMQ